MVLLYQSQRKALFLKSHIYRRIAPLMEDNAIEVSDTKKDDTPEVVLNGQLGSDIDVTDRQPRPL